MTENQNPKRILLVDDDPDYSEVTRTRLEASGYQVSCVSNGREAVEFLDREREPNLIIMDLDMPNATGLTVLIQLDARQKRSNGNGNGDGNGKSTIPVVIATGIQGENIRQILAAQKINGFLTKPYKSEELIQTVKRLIG